MENTSGQGKAAAVPEEIKGWSWGAFLLNWIWAIGNRTWIGLLVFVPFIGFIMSFVLGFKGREWAWRNKHWDSVEHFNRVQKKWSSWGVGVVCISFILGILAGVGAPAYQDYQHRAQEAQIKAATPAPAKPATPLAAKEPSSTLPVPAAPKPVDTVAGSPSPATVDAKSSVQTPPAAAPAPTTSAKPEMRLMTPGELKESQTEIAKSTNKGAEAKQQQPVKESAALPSAVTDGGRIIKAESKAALRTRMDESPAPPLAATGVAAPEPQKGVVTTRFNDVFTAVMYQDQAAVKELLDLGRWVDKPEPGGSTPLMAAVKNDDIAIAELLLKHDANPNAFARGVTAVGLAKRNHNAAMVELLQRYGATVE